MFFRFTTTGFKRLQTLLLILACLIPLGTAGCGLDLFALLSDITQSEKVAYEVFELTNQERAKAGLPALTWNDNLAKAAEAHCQDMIDRNYFAHNTPENLTPGDRATVAGYNWLWVGENIAAGYTTPEQVMQGWMNSPDHKENILRIQFKELGVGVRVSPVGRVYWVQEFGTPESD
ncbi:MAG: CAP domain-containing protein [Phycisphaerae bacterium]|jgi:uncharacterized protein YkwD|nr:CAP domain-containing protein [Phycisphaerae bacterium]